jgi:hypothetical protein
MKTNETTEIQKRMAELLAQQKRTCGSFDGLARAIYEANGEKEHLKVDRRKLSKIVEGTPVSLSFNELQALNTYFALKGEQSLKEVFDKPTLIRSLATTAQLVFLIGAKPQQASKTVALSRWDVRSMIGVIRDVHRISTAVVLDIQDVLLRTPAKGGKRSFVGSEVKALLRDPKGHSVVCIGSPRACHASELMLAKMFDVKPFQTADSSAAQRLPFHFVWSDDQYGELPSSFALKASEVIEDSVTRGDWKSVAIKTTDPEQVYAVDRSKSHWRNYGVIAAQRRQRNQLWIVVAGLSGPSTLAAAYTLVSLSAQLLLENMGKTSPVVWALVESTVKRDRSRGHRGEDRVLVEKRIVIEPRKWPA